MSGPPGPRDGQWDDERGFEVMTLWDFTGLTAAQADQHARQIAERSNIKAVFRRTVTIGPWIELPS